MAESSRPDIPTLLEFQRCLDSWLCDPEVRLRDIKTGVREAALSLARHNGVSVGKQEVR